MNIKYYLTNTQDKIVSRDSSKIITKFGNTFFIDNNDEIIKALWNNGYEVYEISKPEFSSYYLKSYSENKETFLSE